jgi:hypothetical protein
LPPRPPVPAISSKPVTPDTVLSQSELSAFRDRILACWTPPPGVDSNTNVYVELRVLLKEDGSLAQPPVVVAGSAISVGFSVGGKWKERAAEMSAVHDA